MQTVIFYEKPGCQGNKRQKAYLQAHGVGLMVKNLLAEKWDKTGLRAFFADKPVADWFNRSAPAVRDGLIAIDQLSEEQALALMLSQPILIRRPLLQSGGLKQSGFEQGPVFEFLNLLPVPDQAYETCMKSTASMFCGVKP